jgi:hypothetical protein
LNRLEPTWRPAGLAGKAAWSTSVALLIVAVVVVVVVVLATR